MKLNDVHFARQEKVWKNTINVKRRKRGRDKMTHRQKDRKKERNKELRKERENTARQTK